MRRAWAICFSLVFYPLLAVYTAAALAGLSTAMSLGAPFVSHRENMRRFRRMISLYGYGIIRGLARPVVRAVYVSPPRDARKAKVFVSNHVSSSDPFFMAFLPESAVQVVNLWPFKLPVLGIFARLAGYLSIRAMSPEAFQAAGTRLLGEGISIIAFPEGTRAESGPMGPFHGALFRLALATRTPLVPVCIVGNERTPARGSLILEPTTVRVHCLPEMPWESFRDLTPYQLKNHVRQMIQEEVNRMRALA